MGTLETLETILAVLTGIILIAITIYFLGGNCHLQDDDIIKNSNAQFKNKLKKKKEK